MEKEKDKINWVYYLIELIVVFIGITAGFFLNNWREDYNQSKAEEKYLRGFYDDILTDSDNLDSLIIRGEIKTDRLLEIAKQSEVINKPLSEELAEAIVLEMLSIEWFSQSNDTYEDIINSGNLNIISDYELKEKISSYYSFLKEVRNIEKFYRDHMDKYGFPILYKSYHLLKRKFISKSVYQSLEFTNMYLGIIALQQQNTKTYKEALKRNQELKTELVKKLDIKE